jgi:hypothetical protein
MPSLRLPDALVVATADLHSERLVGADEQWAKIKGLSCELELLKPSQ